MVVGPSLPPIYSQQLTRFTLRKLRNWDYVGVALLVLKTQLSQPPSISRGKRPGRAVLVGITGLLVVVSMDRTKQQVFF